MAEPTDQGAQAGALNAAGHDCLKAGDLQTAKARSSEALKIGSRAQDWKRMAGLLDNLGHLHPRLGGLELALDTFQRAARVFEEIGDGQAAVWQRRETRGPCAGTERSKERRWLATTGPRPRSNRRASGPESRPRRATSATSTP